MYTPKRYIINYSNIPVCTKELLLISCTPRAKAHENFLEIQVDFALQLWMSQLERFDALLG